jgi:hypothetical protein
MYFFSSPAMTIGSAVVSLISEPPRVQFRLLTPAKDGTLAKNVILFYRKCFNLILIEMRKLH